MEDTKKKGGLFFRFNFSSTDKNKNDIFLQGIEEIELWPILPKDKNKIDLSCAHNTESDPLSTSYYNYYP